MRPREQRLRHLCVLSSAGLAALTLVAAAPSAHASDRYGGVWHEGTGTGAFVPLEAGFTFAHLQQYRVSWSELRITDFEIHPQSCPAEETDLTASQWEEGSFDDELLVYGSLAELESDLAVMCDEGMVLHDFERWPTHCEQDVQYAALYREGDCHPELNPYVVESDIWDFSTHVAVGNESGHELVDFEVVEPDLSGRSGPTTPEAIGVFYGGEATQYFGPFDRPDFESTMASFEGLFVLQDMESYRDEETRYVAALWDAMEGRDEHEVGEVYGMFGRLLYMDETTRKLEDFEVYPNVQDRRFADTFAQHLNFPQAYGFSVLQGGDVVAEGAGGLALRPVDLPPEASLGVPMTSDTIAVSGSVTKLVTALGVVKYAQLVSTPGDNWLDTPMVDVLPPDFVDEVEFGDGVDEVTLRELVTQQSGLTTFVPTANLVQDPAGRRAAIKDWLTANVEVSTSPKPRKYQNVHFELLAMIMEEVVLAPPTDWQTWVNDEVLAPADIGWRDCSRNGGDARAYPYDWSATSQGSTLFPDNWPCDGNGTGAAMFWISASDMARLGDGIRNATIVDTDWATAMLAEGMGLDEDNGQTAYTPYHDQNPNTFGEVFHAKNGGLDFYNPQGDLVGMRADTVMYDDLDYDDDGQPDYPYEIGFTELSVAVTVQSSALQSGSEVPQYETPRGMIWEALGKPEDW